MRSSSLILTAAASGIVAADTANIFVAEFNQLVPADVLFAQSLGQDSTATTYLLGCRSDLELEDGTLQNDFLSYYCGYEMPFTITQGPSTVAFRRGVQLGGTATLTQDFRCSLAGTTSADCTHTIGGPADGIAELTSYLGEEYAPITSLHYDAMIGTDAASFFVNVALVTDAASIMTSGGPLTVPTGAVSRKKTGTVSSTTRGGGVFTGNFVIVPAPEETGVRSSSLDAKSLVTSMSTAIETTPTIAASETAEASASASGAPTVEGGASSVMGLGAWAAAMVAGIMAVAAL